MRKAQIILVVFCLLIMVNLTHSETIPNQTDIDKGEIINVASNIESKIIVGHGATVIIKSSDQSNARVLANIIDKSQGGVVKKLLNEELKNADINAKTETAEAAIENVIALPAEFTIETAYPNPFNPIVNISYGLPKSGNVKILIHDLSGRKIAAYNISQQTAGWHDFNWNALDQMGQQVGSGIYLLTIQANDMIKKQKITFLK